MREAQGDMWDNDANVYVIPINWETDARKRAVMGAGVALEATKHYAPLRFIFGDVIRRDPDPHIIVVALHSQTVVGFPTKREWRSKATLELIEQGAQQLAQVARYMYGWDNIALPHLGCGLGRLQWTDVRKVLARHFDDSFTAYAL